MTDRCPDCGAVRVFGLTADDPPISFTMHRCEGVQK